MRTEPERYFATKEVSKLTGATLRQLQWWAETGVILARVAGHERRWKPEYLRQAMLCVRFSKSGRYRDRLLTRISALPPAVVAKRFLLFSRPMRVIAASDEQKEIIRIATASTHGVYLVELPANL